MDFLVYFSSVSQWKDNPTSLYIFFSSLRYPYIKIKQDLFSFLLAFKRRSSWVTLVVLEFIKARTRGALLASASWDSARIMRVSQLASYLWNKLIRGSGWQLVNDLLRALQYRCFESVTAIHCLSWSPMWWLTCSDKWPITRQIKDTLYFILELLHYTGKNTLFTHA